MPLLPANSYSVVWVGGFVDDGAATLDAVVNHAGGGSDTRQVKVTGKAGDTFFRVVMVP